MTEPTAAHDHEEALALQPLPACLAPNPAQCARHESEWEHLPAARLPRTGEHVVIDLGHVMWLVILDETRPVTPDNSMILSAGMREAEPCGAVDWHEAHAIEPDDPNLEPEDAAALPTVSALLIAHANRSGT